MTIEELEKKLTELDDLRAELNTQIAALKAQREETKPPHPRWKPAIREEYYSIFHNGHPVLENWSGCSNDEREYEIGNVFRTKAEVEFEAERLKVLAEMREWAGKWDDPYILYYNHISRYVGTTYTQNTNLTYGEMRYATEADAEECVNTVGVDRVKKYYFMIPESE